MFSYFLTAFFARMCMARLRFLPLQFREQEKVTGDRSGEYGGRGNIIVLFLSKIQAQATMCEQRRYHGAKANLCFSTNPGFSGELLCTNCALLASNIPY